jgi:hypothetical protein
MSNLLSEHAMTVSLHLRAWHAKRLDRQTTQEVLDSRNADRDAGRFERLLVPPKSLEAVTKAHTRARQRHYQLTLPWGEDGLRILSSAAFFEYTEAMREERTNTEDACEAFYDKYPALKDEAPRRLGSLYDPNQFPTLEDLKSRFSFQLSILPVPDKDDFRVNISEDIAADLRRQIETTVTDRAAQAQQELWHRLMDTVKHFATTMATDDKKFQNTTVTKLAEIARLAPKLSLKADPVLEEICQDVVKLTAGLSADELRTNKKVRKGAASQAKMTLQKIEDSMKGAF